MFGPQTSVAKDDIAASAHNDGINIAVKMVHDRAMFCITAETGHKVAAGYGVEFNISKPDVALWNEAFPKIVDNDNEPYFHLPLQIDLKSRSDVHGHGIHVKLGACYLTQYCRVYDFDLKIPASSDAVTPVDCRN